MIAWVDGSAGASGDMLLAALADVGVPIEVLAEPVDRLELGVTLRTEPVVRAQIGATRMHVEVPQTRTLRHLAEIVELVDCLEASLRTHVVAVFERLAEAEAKVHRSSRDEVHFHEVGAIDSIADVVGVCAGFTHLRTRRDVTSVRCSTVSLGSGSARSAHGPIPVPVPAVVELLSGRVPVAAGPAPFESTTPTGAALLAHWVDEWGPMPPMTIDAVGLGAGARDSSELCNALRLLLGHAAPST